MVFGFFLKNKTLFLGLTLKSNLKFFSKINELAFLSQKKKPISSKDEKSDVFIFLRKIKNFFILDKEKKNCCQK